MKITLLTGTTFDWEAELGFPIKVIKSALARKLTLRIDEKARLPVLTLPRFCSTRKALQFVESHRDWVTNKLGRLPASEQFRDGCLISILGSEYTLKHHPEERGGVFFEERSLIVCGEAGFIHRRVSDFLKKLAREHLYKMSRYYAEMLGCTIHNVVVKDTKSRWGSCSTKNNINYNWRIIMAPNYVINYLVCHEVSHLAHPDHSPEFWNCVAALCPEYKEGRAWLKLHGKTLYQYT